MQYPVRVLAKLPFSASLFAGAPPPTRKGGINCTLTYTTAHATYPLKCMLTPNVRGNAGCYRPFTVKAPKGSILNCEKPAPVSLRTRTGWYIAPNIFRALSGAAADAVQAFSALPGLLGIYGTNPDGALFYETLLLGGGQGGSSGGDGKSALLWPTSAATSSIELLEGRVPVTRAEMLCEATRRAIEAAVPGDVVLLSPACASFDQFKDYEQRGERFRQFVEALTEDPDSDPCCDEAPVGAGA